MSNSSTALIISQSEAPKSLHESFATILDPSSETASKHRNQFRMTPVKR
jgi:hypothetical protein